MKTVWGSVCLLIVFCGCGGSIQAPAEITDPEQIAIRDLIDQVSAGITKEEFKALFAGEAPKNQMDYQTKYYCKFPQLDPEVTINGDTATVKVEVSTEGADGFQETTDKTWTVTKSDGQWKIQDYPVE